jgi:hypothetical protein
LICLALALAILAAPPAETDLDAIKSERNLEKRSDRALVYAAMELKAAQDAYLGQGDMKQVGASLDQVGAAVELSYDSLEQTHKVPSKSPRHFKRAEIATRELLRRMHDFREQMSVDDRDQLDKVRATVQRIHDSLLQGIMGGKKKD